VPTEINIRAYPRQTQLLIPVFGMRYGLLLHHVVLAQSSALID
jgi:hypothetical protein